MKRCRLLLIIALTSGCGTLNKPPLPKVANGESSAPAMAEEAWIPKLRETNVVYLCLTKSSESESESAWRMIEALRQRSDDVALGWIEIAAGQQTLFDQWQRREVSSAQLIDRFALARESGWLRRGLQPGFAQIALGAPPVLLRKLREGETLSSEEQALLPRDFRPRAEAFDDFADRFSASPRLRRYNLAHLFRAHLAAEQIVAANIVRFLADHPASRLFVILPNEIPLDPREIAGYVAQKMKLRQMILDRSNKTPISRPPLLARR